MAASSITRDFWVNDSGTFANPVGDGTAFTNAVLQNNIYARIDELFTGAAPHNPFTLGGRLSVEGFGAHDFNAGGTGGNALSVRNTTAGTSNFGALQIGNDTAIIGLLAAASTTFSTAADFAASGVTLRASGAGGLLLSANYATGSIRIHTGSSYNERLRIQASGAVAIGDTYDAGAPSLRVVSSATLTPLVTVGSDSATSGVAAFFVSNSAARACVLALADGSSYASAIGADGSGNFNYWAGRSPGTAGTSVFSVSTTGVMTANGFGSHLHSAGGTGFNVLEIRNTTAGTGNGAQVKIGNDGSAGLLSLQATSTTYTSTPDRGSLTAIGTGGLDIVSFDANAPVRFLVANAQVMQLHSNGSISMFTGTAPSPGNFHCNGPLIATNVSLNSGTVLPSLISTGFACAVWPTTATAANLVGVNGNVISVSTSLRAIKTDIHSITTEDAISAVLRLRAVHYRSILPNDTDRVWPGFIADEVEDAAPHLAVYRADDGSLQSVAYDRVAAYLVPVAQDHESRLRALEARL